MAEEGKIEIPKYVPESLLQRVEERGGPALARVVHEYRTARDATDPEAQARTMKQIGVVYAMEIGAKDLEWRLRILPRESDALLRLAGGRPYVETEHVDPAAAAQALRERNASILAEQEKQWKSGRR